MARKELMNPPNGVFTLNETAIGRGQTNRKRSDVQLIQFFLHQFFLKNPSLFAQLPPTRNKVGVIKIDGEYGKQTEAGILVFQQDVQKRGSRIKVDGVVNIATNTRSTSGNQFTIIFMNFFFMTLGDGKEHHGKLENHPLVFSFAPELAGELFTALVRDDF